MITRAFSTREKVLLIILVILLVLAAYFLAVFRPTMESMSASQAKIDEIADLMKIEEEKSEQILKMQQELEQVKGTAATNAITPLYDNFQNLLDELNTALAATDSYKLNFLAPVIKDGVATRELQLIFYSSDYYTAKRIIEKLYSGTYRCDITAFKLVPSEKDSYDLTSVPVTATLSLLYYEIYKAE